MRAGLGPGVEAKHGHDDAVEFRRDAEAAAAVAVGYEFSVRARTGDNAELGAKGASQRPGRAGECEATGSGVPRSHLDRGLKARQDAGDQVVIRGSRPVAVAQFGAGHPGRYPVGIARQAGCAPRHHGQLNALLRVHRAGRNGTGK